LPKYDLDSDFQEEVYYFFGFDIYLHGQSSWI